MVFKTINIGLENDRELDDNEVDYQLSFLEPIDAKWLISLYNHMSSPDDIEIILSGWKISDIFDTIHLGSTCLLRLDLSSDLCLLMKAAGPTEALSLSSLFPEELDCFQGSDENHSDEDHSE